MPYIRKWSIRLSIIVIERLVFWLLEAKKHQIDKLDNEWQQRLSDIQLIGCACSLPEWEKPTYKNVSIQFPDLSKRQIYKIIEKRKKMDEKQLSTREWQNFYKRLTL